MLISKTTIVATSLSTVVTVAGIATLSLLAHTGQLQFEGTSDPSAAQVHTSEAGMLAIGIVVALIAAPLLRWLARLPVWGAALAGIGVGLSAVFVAPFTILFVVIGTAMAVTGIGGLL